MPHSSIVQCHCGGVVAVQPSKRPSLRVRSAKIDNSTPASLRETGREGSSTASSPNKDQAEAYVEAKAARKQNSMDPSAIQRRFETTQRRCWKLENDLAKRNDQIAHWKKKCEDVWPRDLCNGRGQELARCLQNPSK